MIKYYTVMFTAMDVGAVTVCTDGAETDTVLESRNLIAFNDIIENASVADIMKNVKGDVTDFVVYADTVGSLVTIVFPVDVVTAKIKT